MGERGGKGKEREQRVEERGRESGKSWLFTLCGSGEAEAVASLESAILNRTGLFFGGQRMHYRKEQ